MLRRHKLGMWGPAVKACRRSVHKQRLPSGSASCRADRRHPGVRGCGSPVRGVRAEEEPSERRPRTRPGPGPRHPPTTVPGFAFRLAGIPESFEEETETYSARSIDDPSSIPQSSLSGKPVAVRDIELGSPGSSLLPGRSTHSCTTDPRTKAPAPPRFVPVRFAPAHPGSSRSWRGARRRVAVPRLSRDGVPPCLCRNTAATRRTSPDGRPGAVRAGRDRPGPMTAVSGDAVSGGSVPPGFRPAPSVRRVGADDAFPRASVLP